jgi:hypothetical protein
MADVKASGCKPDISLKMRKQNYNEGKRKGLLKSQKTIL